MIFFFFGIDPVYIRNIMPRLVEKLDLCRGKYRAVALGSVIEFGGSGVEIGSANAILIMGDTSEINRLKVAEVCAEERVSLLPTDIILVPAPQ